MAAVDFSRGQMPYDSCDELLYLEVALLLPLVRTDIAMIAMIAHTQERSG
jgi:hypothetical protein